MLVDPYGRTLDYLRLSVTDRCNFRCLYCMPPEGVEWKPHEAMLSFEEILRLCRIFADLGIRKIRVSGGEPLVRKGVASFLKNLKTLPGIERVTLTTNGSLLGAYLDEAEAMPPPALPDGINISLNALDTERYKAITRNSDLNPRDIVQYIDRLQLKHIQVKINCVPVRGFNEGEIIPLAGLARERDIAVRFIELMPIGSGADYEYISGSETAKIIEKAFGSLTPYSGVESSGPAVYYSLKGFAGKIGFINPISHGFCETCNRLRLNPEGKMKLCLSYEHGPDLRELLRSNAADSEIARAITDAAARKPRFHNLSGVYGAAAAENEPPPEPRARHPVGMFGIGG